MSALLLNKTTFGNPANSNNVLTVQEVNDLLNNWVENSKLKWHMFQVGYLMKCWALEVENCNQNDAWRWQMAGILHDADWDKWPEQHCKKIITYLEEQNIDPEIIRAIASHGPIHFGVDPVTNMDKILYAFDELSGLIHAYSLMRPEGYEGMELKGVKKRLKDKAFAANVSRDDITDACQRAGISLDDLISFIIKHQPNTPESIL